MILGHRWFDLYELEGLIDLGVIYNGTTAAELGLIGIPSVVCEPFCTRRLSGRARCGEKPDAFQAPVALQSAGCGGQGPEGARRSDGSIT